MLKPRLGGRGEYGLASRLRNLAALWITLAAAPGLAAAEPVTVAALGDSLTAGFGLAAPDGFVPRLQAWLDARGADATVINAGVSGDTTAGGLARVDWTLAPEVDAMIVALGGNDFLRGVDPAESRANLRGILEAAAARGVEVLLVGIDASGQYGPDYEAAFDAMYPELAAEFGALYEPDWFAALREGGRPLHAAIGTDMQADGIHPSAAGVGRIVERIGPRVLELVEAARQGG
jgi:acyl-CoA thioesterase-1